MGVTVGTNQKEKRKRLLSIAGIVGLLLLAGAAGVGVRWWQSRGDNNPEAVLQQGSGFSKDVDTIQDLRAQGNIDGSNHLIDEALKKRDLPQSERYILYIQQGNNLIDKQDLQGAIASYLKAEEVQRTYEIMILLGDTYKAAGDNAKAIEYYKKGLSLVPDGPLKDDEKASLEQMIRDLEGGA